jgi:hypothetical protein
MNWILRAIGAAALGFAVLLATATPGTASSYTLNFTGTATVVGGAFATLGAASGDPISGTLTLDPLPPDNPFPNPSNDVFLGTATFSFHISNPGLDLTRSGSGSGFVQSSQSGGSSLTFNFGTTGVSNLFLSFSSDGSTAALGSLSGLPTTASGIIAMLGGTLGVASGNFQVGSGGLDHVHFDIAFTPTPIPAALPLFVSALGGLGFIGWRRRRAA